MVRVTITIPEEMKKKLEELARDQDRSISYIIREMLQKQIEDSK